MNKKFKDADEFFGRTVEEYKQWLISNTREQLDFVLMDLISLSQDQNIVIAQTIRDLAALSIVHLM